MLKILSACFFILNSKHIFKKRYLELKKKEKKAIAVTETLQ